MQVINALLGDRYLEEGILPTTNEISVLKFAEDGVGSMEQNADGFFVRRLAAVPCRCVVSDDLGMQRTSLLKQPVPIQILSILWCTCCRTPKEARVPQRLR